LGDYSGFSLLFILTGQITFSAGIFDQISSNLYPNTILKVQFMAKIAIKPDKLSGGRFLMRSLLFNWLVKPMRPIQPQMGGQIQQGFSPSTLLPKKEKKKIVVKT
jgi:hypothetical protein